MRIEQQSDVLCAARRGPELQLDMLSRERGAVALADLLVGLAVRPGRHHDRARRHACEHEDGRAGDRAGRERDRECRPMMSQDVSGRHCAPVSAQLTRHTVDPCAVDSRTAAAPNRRRSVTAYAPPCGRSAAPDRKATQANRTPARCRSTRPMPPKPNQACSPPRTNPGGNGMTVAQAWQGVWKGGHMLKTSSASAPKPMIMTAKAIES